MLVGHVGGLGPVLHHVVELPGLPPVGRDELPLAGPNGVVVCVRDVEGIVRARRPVLVLERRHQALPLRRHDLSPLVDRRIASPCGVEACREEVHDVAKPIRETPGVRNAVRPVGNARRGNSPFVGPDLVASKRSVADVGPGPVVAHVGFGRPGFRIGRPIEADGGRPVVRDEEKKGVFELSGCLQRIHDPADALVHPVNHAGVRGHHPRPSPLIIHLRPVRNAGVPVRKAPLLVDNSLRDLAFVPGAPDGVPPLLIARNVLLDVFFPRLNRPVRGRVGQVEKERIIVPGAPLDEVDGLRTQEVRHVEVGHQLRLRLEDAPAVGGVRGVLSHNRPVRRRVEVIAHALQNPTKGIKPPGIRPVSVLFAKMPLP